MEIDASITGVASLVDKLAELKATTRKAEVLGITRVALALRDQIVKYTNQGHPDHPEVQTGRLKASIRYVIEEGTEVKGYVGSDAEYAPHVEFGHRQEPGRFVPALGKRLKAGSVKPYPFVRPAIVDVADGGIAKKLFEGAVKEVLKIG